MYKNVGKEIKTWVDIIVWVQMIPVVLMGILAIVMMAEQSLLLGIGLGAVIIGVGHLLARLSGMIMYAFGEIAERILSIDEKLSKQTEESQAAK